MKHLFSIRNIYFFSALALFVYLILRAINVPPVHDEAATYIHYIQQGEWMPYSAHWDANNHILNSLLSGWIFKIFGFGLLQLRLVSLLSFILFAVYIFRISKFLQSNIVKIGFLVGMLGAHNLMEYFGYSRGYGMSMGLLIAAMFYLIRYFQQFELRKLWPFYIFSLLALMANLTLFNTMLLLNGLILLSFLLKNKKWLLKILYILCGLLPIIFAAIISMEMKKLGLLYYGGNKSFYHVTVATLSLLIYGDWNTALCIAFIIVAIISILFLIASGMEEGLKDLIFSTRWLFAILFIGNIIATVLLQKWLKVNYPEDRTAMYFYFFLVMFFCFSLDKISFDKIKYVALIWVVAPIHFFFMINTTHASYWYYEHIPPAFYKKIQQRAGNDPASVSIGGYNLMDMIWAYYNQGSGGQLNDMQVADYPSFYYDYLILYNDNNNAYAQKDYNTLLISPYSEIRLLERKEKIKMDLVASYTHPDHWLDTNEYFNFYSSDSLSRYKNLCVDIDCNIFSPDHFLFAYVTLGTFYTRKDGEEKAGPHEWQALHHFRSNWRGNNRFHHCVYITGILPDSSRSVCYLWNPKKQPVTLTDCRIKIYGFNY
jgi:hypothetical protein